MRRKKSLVWEAVCVLKSPNGILLFAVLALVGHATGVYSIYSPQPYGSYFDAASVALLAMGLAFLELAIILVALAVERGRRKPAGSRPKFPSA